MDFGNRIINPQGIFKVCSFKIWIPGKPCELSYNALRAITGGFDRRPVEKGGRLVGKGGFGEVFIGIYTLFVCGKSIFLC